MKFKGKSQILIDDLFPELFSVFPDLDVYSLDEIKTESDKKGIVVDETLEPEQVVAAFNSHNLRHLVQKNKGHFEKSLVSAGRLIGSGSGYFDSHYAFSVETPSRTELIEFRGKNDKDNLMQVSNNFIEVINSMSVSTGANAIIEELYMNAVIDAPREAEKKGTTVHDPISSIFLCHTEKWLQISCSDPFGSLDVNKFLNRMQEVYTKGAGQAINLQAGNGAGLGCVILFEYSTCLILGVQPNKKTKVTCMIPLGVSNKQRAQMKKSLHWFQL